MPPTRRQIYRRRRVVVGIAGVLVLGTAFYLPLTLLAPVHAISAELEPYTAPPVVAPALTFPEYGASAVGAVGYSGLLASAGVATPLPIASISKVITALVVLDAKPLALGEPGPDVTLGPADEDFYNNQLAQNGVVEPVYSGQVISERTMLNVMLMASANNYAESVANWAFGSQAAFVDAARVWLAREGLTATNLNEPTGVDPGNVSSVADLVEIGKRALQNPVVAEIVSTRTIDVPEVGTIDNRNSLLGIDGIDGIKTGTLDEAGSCLLFSAEHPVGSQTVTIVGVVLGGPDHDTIDAAIRALLAQVDAGFTEVNLTTRGEQFASYETPWGDAATAVATQDTPVALWTGTPVTLATKADTVELAEDGTRVGTLTFTVGERTIEVPLELEGTIDDPGPWWRLTNPQKLF